MMLDVDQRAMVATLHAELAAIATGIARVTDGGVPLDVGRALAAAASATAQAGFHLAHAAHLCCAEPGSAAA